MVTGEYPIIVARVAHDEGTGCLVPMICILAVAVAASVAAPALFLWRVLLG